MYKIKNAPMTKKKNNRKKNIYKKTDVILGKWGCSSVDRASYPPTLWSNEGNWGPFNPFIQVALTNYQVN